MLDLLQALNDRGRTIVLITHEHDVAERADRILRIEDGLVSDAQAGARAALQSGRPAEVALTSGSLA